MQGRNKELIEQLQNRIMVMQGLKRLPGMQYPHMGLGAIEEAFPDKTFPVGAVHEFISPAAESAVATNGFISGMLGKLMGSEGLCVWISCRRTLFPPALQLFGIVPHQVIFIDLPRERDVLWAVEEALKCNALAAVVGELRELDFNQSRRLQLVVEKSRVTGFIHRHQPKMENTVACMTRWKINPLPGAIHGDMPGLTFPRWHVELSRVRNGKPSSWDIEWSRNEFRQVNTEVTEELEDLLSVATYA